MAPVLKPATRSSSGVVGGGGGGGGEKRKAPEMYNRRDDGSGGGGDYDDGDDDEMDDGGGVGGGAASYQQLKQGGDGSQKQGEQVVTKRTLQNRKAQREFRKRREARVRDLEERCRRYDQMGIEANSELQRVARRFKDENDALRGLLIRLGFGGMIPNALEGIGNEGFAPGLLDQQPGSSVAGAGTAAGTGNHSDLDEVAGATFTDPLAALSNFDTRTRNSSTKQQASFDASASAPTQAPQPTFDMSSNPAGQSMPAPQWPSSMRRPSTHSVSDASSPSSARSSQNGNPLLSLSLHQASTRQSQSQQQQQQQPQHQQSSSSSRGQQGQHPSKLDGTPVQSGPRLAPGLSPGGVLNALTGQDASSNSNNGNNHNQQHSGAGLSGSAMLGGPPMRGFGMSPNGSNQGINSHIYPVPQRTHQNDALLNPNPIPFAFNLSNEPPPPSQASWWEQMGGGRLSPGNNQQGVLDEKAQAVAMAQTNNGGSQSPFDLSAFLQGGNTPGGNFFFGFGSPHNQPPSSQEEGGEGGGGGGGGGGRGWSPAKSGNGSGGSGPGTNNDTDHMRMFIRLLERKVAEREARTVAALGFQPPSQDPSQRSSHSWLTAASPTSSHAMPRITNVGRQSLTPSGFYSRLAEHPAFLSTSAKELEELVDAIGSGAARSPTGSDDGLDSRPSHNSDVSHNSNSVSRAIANRPSRSPSSHSNSSEPSLGVEVDEGAVHKLLGLLDRKSPRHRLPSPHQSFNMAMT